MTCVVCGADAVSQSTNLSQFKYGKDGPLIAAWVPVNSCSACGESWLDERGEVAQHEAVCRHLGRLTPAEIRSIRASRKLTQAQLAKQTGIGVASIKRWETGNVIQTASLDTLLRQLGTQP